MRLHHIVLAAAAAASSSAFADVTLLTQQRSITAATSADGNTQTLSAPDFSPFVQNLSLSSIFQGQTGPLTNVAVTRIDCQVDPNRITANGLLTVGGGTSSGGATEVGDAKVAVLVTFQVQSPTPFSLVAASRPDVNATDEFVLELKDLTTNNRLFRLENTDPAQAVDFAGTMQPGDYSITYRVECTGDASELSRDYSFTLAVPAPAGGLVLGLGGLLAVRRRRVT